MKTSHLALAALATPEVVLTGERCSSRSVEETDAPQGFPEIRRAAGGSRGRRFPAGSTNTTLRRRQRGGMGEVVQHYDARIHAYGRQAGVTDSSGGDTGMKENGNQSLEVLRYLEQQGNGYEGPLALWLTELAQSGKESGPEHS